MWKRKENSCKQRLIWRYYTRDTEDGERPGAKESLWVPETPIGKERDSLPESPEGTRPADIWILAHQDSFQALASKM